LYRESHGNVPTTRHGRDSDAPCPRHRRDGGGAVEGGVERAEDWRIAKDRPEKILHWKGVDRGLGIGLGVVVLGMGGWPFSTVALAHPPTPSRLREGEKNLPSRSEASFLHIR